MGRRVGLLGTEHRGWACSRARGDTLEVAIGTGLNLPHYPSEVRLTGVYLSPDILAYARIRSKQIGRRVTLSAGDAAAADFDIQARDRLRMGIVERLVARSRSRAASGSWRRGRVSSWLHTP